VSKQQNTPPCSKTCQWTKNHRSARHTVEKPISM